MSIVSDVLGAIDDGRAMLDDVGLRPFRVFVRTTTYDGERVGDGVAASSTREITVARGARPKVRQLDDKEVVASGGTLGKPRFEVGPLTPAYDGGGTKATDLEPVDTLLPTEVHYVLIGPGTPATGALCKGVSSDFSSPFRYTLTIEALGQGVDG